MSRHTLSLFIFLWVSLLGRLAKADHLNNGFCKNLQLSQIPVGDFRLPRSMPMSTMRVTQKYNTSFAEGYCQAPGQPSGSSKSCQGYKVYYGHDGLDLHPQGAKAGQNDIYAIQPGVVIATHASGSFSGWGESIVLVTRKNSYSEELLTFHYHHLYATFSPYQTTRLFSYCDQVEEGDVLAKEGGTPNWPTHLHLSIKQWKNLAELNSVITKTPSLFYGYGYTFGDNTKIANFLDPRNYLYDNYREFQEDASTNTVWQWAISYAREMRNQGWFFGEYEGSFGVSKNVKRREAARWVKIAREIPNSDSSKSAAGFSDLTSKDPDWIYVQSLLDQPATLKVINPAASCQSGSKKFCPDQDLKRAEAIKMLIAAFYQEDFLHFYQNWVWETLPENAFQLLTHYNDVSAYDWYAPYIYFAWQKKLLGADNLFRPGDPIKRAEFAKWLVLGYQNLHKAASTFCHTKLCQAGNYCSPEKLQCCVIPSCLPLEGQNCPLGGGYQGGNMSGGTGGSSGSGNSSQIYDCKLDPNFQAACKMDTGICESTGKMVCTSTGLGLECNAQSKSPNPAGEICGNQLDDNCNGVIDEWPCQPQSTGSAGSSPGPSGSGGVSNPGSAGSPGNPGNSAGNNGSAGTAQCSVQYLLSPNLPACLNNIQASGSPMLCLEVKQLNGSQWQWRVCKNQSIFQSSFIYQLLDQNHLSQSLGFYQSASGSSCSVWQTSNFNYLTQNGPNNGAGLLVEVHSPLGCTSPACTYYTGPATLYRSCQ